MLQARLELSERRACRVTGQHRSPQRRLPARGRGDDVLRTEVHAFSRGHPRWGYCRAWATLREEGWTVNRKRVQRLWREEGLRVPAKRRKRQRLGHSAVPAARLRAERLNHVWALDFQFDQTADGRVLKLLNIVDEHTREALAIVAARSITADATVSTLEGIVARRGMAPASIRCDNGPELTANALRDWCRFSGTGSSDIEPGAPWENPYDESFNAGCATSSWPSSSSTACSRRRCCSRTGGSSTTRSARTAAWAGSPRLPTPSAGRLSYTLDSHKRWSRKGGPVRLLCVRIRARRGAWQSRCSWGYGGLREERRTMTTTSAAPIAREEGVR